MRILNAMDLKAGAKADHSRMYSISQPLQFLPREEKDDDWAYTNMDWLEWQGLKQLRKNARRLMKNYKLAKGIIDRTDYIMETDNEMKDLVETLAYDEPSALELKFYPIIPNVINVLVSEFAKRDKRVTFRATDEYTFNELLEGKRAQIEDVLVRNAEAKLVSRMLEMGADPEDPEIAQKLQEQLQLENLKTLPEIQEFFSKDYEVLVEKWASKQHIADEERFSMDELEERAFRDMLITDREFWHFVMGEDDYDIELWNPVLTFYHKSPDKRYISEGNWVGKTEMATASDIIDKFGWLMTEEQLLSLQHNYPIRAAGYSIGGYQNDGTFYDATKSHAWNVQPPSLAYRQFTSMFDNFLYNGNDIVEWVMGESEDYSNLGAANMLRVTQCYWKSQRRVGHLTKITEAGEFITDVIDESYKVTDKPVYNTQLIKNKSERNLIFGEHIEWIWINQVWGGVKIGPNHPSFWGMKNAGGINPIYLGIDQNKIAPLKFQLKGDKNLYGTKLPVEGAVFSDRNTRSTSLVDSMKPSQIGFNMVNNQIVDILIDEIGTVVVLDQNAIPKHSLGEDWGKQNYAKAFVAMKDFGILPLDTSIANTENALNFQHFQQLDLSQTQRLMSRVQLANYFKAQAFEVVGVTPQRMGQQIGQYQTATGVEQAVTGSYAQTEEYFAQHSDRLMPRVHKMRTDIAQFYASTKPSVRIQLLTAFDERVNFEVNGTDLLLRDLNVSCSTKANHRFILEKMRSMAEQTAVNGKQSIYDLGKVLEADSLGTLNTALKKMEEDVKKNRQAEMAHEEKLKQMELEQRDREKALILDAEAREKEKDRRKDVLVAEIRAAGMTALPKSDEGDFAAAMDQIRKGDEYQQNMNIKRESVSDKRFEHAQNVKLKQDQLNVQREMKEKDLQIARENKNRFDQKKTSSDKKKK